MSASRRSGPLSTTMPIPRALCKRCRAGVIGSWHPSNARLRRRCRRRRSNRFHAAVGQSSPSASLLSLLAGVGYRLWPAPDPAVRLAVLPFDTVGLLGGDTPQIDGLFDE